MGGNATEEGLILQIGNPSHVDPGRIIVPAALISGALTYIGARWVVPDLTVWGGIVLGSAAGLLVAWRLALWFQRRAIRQFEREMQAGRVRQIAETERQLAAMRLKAGQ